MAQRLQQMLEEINSSHYRAAKRAGEIPSPFRSPGSKHERTIRLMVFEEQCKADRVMIAIISRLNTTPSRR